MSQNSSDKPLSNLVAIVTGGGQSLGRSHALRLAEVGAKVLVNDLGAEVGGEGSDISRAEAVAVEIRAMGGEAVSNTDSVASLVGGRKIVQAALDAFGRVDILVNNAGVLRPNLIFDVTDEDIDLTLDVHMRGTFALTIAVAPHFREQRSGVIINTGSEAGLGHYGNSIYSAAKEGIAGFTRTIARDFGPHGVRANLIRPAAMSRQATNSRNQELIIEAEKTYGFKSSADYWLTEILGDNLTPEHVSDFIAWLCTDEAAHINGCDFRVMGGEISLLAEPHPIRTVYRDERWTIDALNKPSVAGNLYGHLHNKYLDKRRTN